MPRIALLSDIHANLPALRAVLDEIDGMVIDQIVHLGDIVGYGPHPAECVKLVRETGGPCVLGNHDFYTIVAHNESSLIPSDAESMTNPVWAGIRHAVRHLDPSDFKWLEALPRTLEIPGAIIAHAALHDRDRWPYLLKDGDARETLGILKKSGIDIGFFGHTHRQDFFPLPGGPSMETDEIGFTLPEGGICAVVVGSVGQPRTRDPRAGWTLWDSEARRFEFRRTPYPFEETASAIYQAGLPASSAIRLSGGG